MLSKNKISLKEAVDNSLRENSFFQFTREQTDQIKMLSQALLTVVAAAGAITLGSAIPGTLKIINHSARLRKKFKGLAFDQKQKKLERAFYYLRSSGLIYFSGEAGLLKIFLTQKAEKFIRKLSFTTMQVRKPKIWDRKWWLVAADIPTKEHRLGADKFRRKLKDMNFFSLQRTLWLYPYDPRKEISFVSHTYGIGRFVTVMEINRLDVEDAKKVKSFFGL